MEFSLRINLKNAFNHITIMLYSLFLTKNCFKISLSIFLLFTSWLIYIFSLIDYNDFSLSKFESQNSFLWITVWMVNFVIVLLFWNFFLFLFISVNKYIITKGNGNIIPFLVEKFYINLIFSVLLLYYFKHSFFNNLIDCSFWISIESMYFFLIFYIVQFYKNFDREIFSLTDFASNKFTELKWKIHKVSLFFFIFNLLYVLFLSVLLSGVEISFEYNILCKGGYIMIKLFELYLTRMKQMNFLHNKMREREKTFVTDLKAKTFSELITMAFVYYHLAGIFIYAECQYLYINIVMFGMLLLQFYFGIIYYRKYENLKEDYRHFDLALSKKSTKDEDCVICSEKLDQGRLLNCGHCIHLICISIWIGKGNKVCPLCGNDLNIQHPYFVVIHPLFENRQMITLNLGSRNFLFGYILKISMKITRTTDNNDNNRDNNSDIRDND